MRYSCFRPELGLYDYFEDGATLPLNADLPVPTLPPDSGRAGLASIHAARSLPRGAHRTGRGWHAQGQVVKCPQGGMLNGLGAVETGTLLRGAVVVGVVGIGLWFVFSLVGGSEDRRRGPIDEERKPGSAGARRSARGAATRRGASSESSVAR